MRALSKLFMNDLQAGILQSILARVHADDTLDLHIRHDSLNVYYRGVSLLRVNRGSGGVYLFAFDTNYFRAGPIPPGFHSPYTVTSATECDQWIEFVPFLKDTMDRWLTTVKSQREREVQQLLVRENTRDDATATGTDYFVIDVEYARVGARADAVAVHWPSTATDRKRKVGHQLALIEVKYGDGALTGNSGLHKHVADAELLAANPQELSAFRTEMLKLFEQKHDLGLIRHKHKLASFDDAQDPPLQLIFVVANHNPASTVLSRELSTLQPAPHVQVLVAMGNALGYGLYDRRLLTVAEYLHQFP